MISPKVLPDLHADQSAVHVSVNIGYIYSCTGTAVQLYRGIPYTGTGYTRPLYRVSTGWGAIVFCTAVCTIPVLYSSFEEYSIAQQRVLP